MKTNAIALGGISIIIAAMLAAVAVFGIQSVAALTDATSTAPTDATSTAPVDTEPSEQPADDVAEPVETASSTTEVVAATTTVDASGDVVASTTTPAEASPAEEAQASKPSPEAVSADVAGLEDAYYKETGRYLQILRGNDLPTYESGTVSEKLGAAVPNDAWVHVYEAPAGKGYQVFFEADGVLHSVGYGPEAGERTFTRSTIVSPSATSTMP